VSLSESDDVLGSKFNEDMAEKNNGERNEVL
jgi:hypothetical protein